MPVVSQSIISPMVPVGASTEAWRVAHAELLAVAHAASHDCWAAASSSAGTSCVVDVGERLAVHAQHPQHVLLVLGVAGERAHAAGGAGGRGVGVAGHERR